MKKLLFAIALLLLVAAPVGRSANFLHGSVTCPGSGTAQLASTATKASFIVAQSPLLPTPNTGRIHFGGSGVTTSGGVYILPGDSYSWPPEGNSAVFDLRQIYFACTVNSDIVTFDYVQ